MIDKPITIVSSELKTSKTNKEYLEVVDHEGVKFSCWDNELWNSLGKDLSVRVGFEQKGIFKNIVKVESIAEELAPKVSPADKPAPPSPKVVSGEERGMWWKEVGEMIRAGVIKKETAEGRLMIRAYYAQMFASLGIEIKQKGE